MAYEKKNGDLAVFKNDRKEKDSHPDYTISGLGLDGFPIKGALWLKEDRNGKKFMAGKIEIDQYLIDKNPDQFRSSGTRSVAGGGGGGDYQESGGRDLREKAYNILDDDLPFLIW
jgi:hypothetical protein